MFEHVLIPVTPSGGFIAGRTKERVCPARRTNIVFVSGREKVKLEGDFRGRGSVTLTSIPSRERKIRVKVFIGGGSVTLTPALSP